MLSSNNRSLPSSLINLPSPAVNLIPDERFRMDSEIRDALYHLREKYEYRAQAIDSWIEEIEELMEQKPKGSRDAVLAALEAGCTTVKQIEIYLDGKLRHIRIYEILIGLAEKDLVEIRETVEKEGKTHNKQLHYFLTHSTSFQPLRK